MIYALQLQKPDTSVPPVTGAVIIGRVSGKH
jgi:hypothetical protein